MGTFAPPLVIDFIEQGILLARLLSLPIKVIFSA